MPTVGILGQTRRWFTYPVPPVPIIVPKFGRVIRYFGCSTQYPSLILTRSNTAQTFIQPSVIANAAPLTIDLIQPFAGARGTPDGFQLLGQSVMPDELLVGPQNGRLAGRIYYIVASGSVLIPASASGAALNFVLAQNYFSLVGRTPTLVESDTMATRLSSQSLTPGQSYNWFIVCKLSGNSPNNGILAGDWTININGNVSIGRFYSNVNPFVEPIIQLSLATQFSGSLSGGDVFLARMTQFEIQMA